MEALKIFDIPVVECKSDGITVNFEQKGTLKTELAIKDYLDNSTCRKIYTAGINNGNFSVKYGNCGVELKNNTAEFTLMVLRPPRQIRISAQTRLIRCEYPTKEDVAKNSFKVGDLRTVTDLPSTTFSDENPTHELIVMDLHNNPVDKAEPGTGLIGKFRISTIPYVASIKNCYLKPDQKGNITGHQIINEFGCPVDQDVTVWRWDPKTNSLQFTFKAFKFLDWKENHISCQVNYCLKKSDCAPPSNCEDTPKPCEEPKM